MSSFPNRECHRSAAVDVHSIRLKLRDSPETKLTVQPLTEGSEILSRLSWRLPVSQHLFPRSFPEVLVWVPFLKLPGPSWARLTDLVVLAMTCSSQMIPTLDVELSHAGKLMIPAEAYRGRRRNSGA